jgi:CIC family chloride channel protein
MSEDQRHIQMNDDQAMHVAWLDRVFAGARAALRQREDQVFLVLSLVIGALTGLVVVAFIVLTEHVGIRLYPVGSAAWRRVLFPMAGSLGIGYLLYRYFPNARGSGVPQTKAALYAREVLSFRSR